jgi:hypothetical protein
MQILFYSNLKLQISQDLSWLTKKKSLPMKKNSTASQMSHKFPNIALGSVQETVFCEVKKILIIEEELKAKTIS